MTEATKMIVCATKRSYDRKIAASEAKGWTVERKEVKPRPRSRKVYVAYLKREKGHETDA